MSLFTEFLVEVVLEFFGELFFSGAYEAVLDHKKHSKFKVAMALIFLFLYAVLLVSILIVGIFLVIVGMHVEGTLLILLAAFLIIPSVIKLKRDLIERRQKALGLD